MSAVERRPLALQPHHVGISVPDLEAAIAWYSEMLDFSLDQQFVIEAIPARIAFLKRDNFRIELFEVADSQPLPDDRRYPNCDLRTHGTKHLAFAVPDVDAAVAALRQRGVDIALELTVLGKPTAFIRDNAGTLIELVRASDFQ